MIGAASGPRKLAIARGLGGTPPSTTADRAGKAKRVTVSTSSSMALAARSAGRVFGRLKRGGRFVSFGMASGAFSDVTDEEAARRGVELRRGLHATPAELRELSRAALAEAAAGRLRPLIGQTFPLAQAADAHAAMERRETIGKTLLIVRSA